MSEGEIKTRPLYAPHSNNKAFADAMAKRGTAGASYSPASSPSRKQQQQRVILDFSKIEMDAGFPRALLTLPSTTNTTSMTYPTSAASCEKKANVDVDYHHKQQLKIRVNEAVVDFHKLVQLQGSTCATASSSAILPKRTGRSRLLRRRQQQQVFTVELDPYERAMELELEVSFVKRTYTARRSLQQILQLRHDLLEELALQEHWHRRRSQKAAAAASMYGDAAESSNSSNCCSTSLGDSSCSRGSNSCTDEDEGFLELLIPDLPRMSDDTLGMFGGGFLQMNAMRQALRVALEVWFHQTILIVRDDSPTLANFLWEALSTSRPKDSLHSDVTKLRSIEED